MKDVLAALQGVKDFVLDWAEKNPLYAREIVALALGIVIGAWAF